MIGLGTIINVAAVIVGGLIGLLFGKLINEKIQKIIITCNGICVMFIGISGAMAELLVSTETGFSTHKSLLMLLSIILGTIIGTLLKLDSLVERFGNFLKRKTKSSGDNSFTEAFVTASCTVCIGAMSVIGAINDAMFGDISLLITKSILDLITVCILTCSMGKGAIFSAISVLVIQGLITALAWFIKPIMTDNALSALSLSGSVLIFVVGLNLIREEKIPVVNMLPSILVAVGLSFIPWLN